MSEDVLRSRVPSASGHKRGEVIHASAGEPSFPLSRVERERHAWGVMVRDDE